MTTEPKPQYPPFSEKGYALMNKWTHFDQCNRYPDEWPLEKRTELVIVRDQIPAFLEDLRKLRLGVRCLTTWLLAYPNDPTKSFYTESRTWETPNIYPGDPGWVDYSIDYVIACLHHHPKPVASIGSEGAAVYRESDEIEALGFGLDLYGEYPDTPGPVQKESFDDEDWPCVYEKYPDLFNKQ